MGRRIAFASAAVVLVTTAFLIAIWPSPGEQHAESMESARTRLLEAGLPAEHIERMQRTERARLDSLGPLHDFRVRMIPTILGALLAIAGGVTARPLALVTGFLCGFFPFWIGLYFLLVGWYPSLIGLGELMYLVAAVLIWRGNRAEAAVG